MRTGVGWVREVRIDYQGRLAAWIRCDPGLLPEPGQYLMGWNPLDIEAPLAAELFPGKITEQGFLALEFPRNLEPGTALELRGPLGRGFRLPADIRRLALVAFSDGPDHLLPLADLALSRGAAVALYCDPPFPSLPSSIEVSPLDSLADALDWADFFAAGVSSDYLAELEKFLDNPFVSKQLNGQVLLRKSMPCGGLSSCGACAVAVKRGWKYACKDGPVFDLQRFEF